MNIVALKQELFTDLKDPMTFIEHKKMNTTSDPVRAKQFGTTTYFYAENGDEWRVNTDECRVMVSSINTFSEQHQKLVVSCSESWTSNIREKLEAAAKLAFTSDEIKKREGETFEAFWEKCKVPNTLSIETYAFSRRGKRHIYIPMFFGKKEITGQYQLEVGDVVNLSIRWHLCQTIDGDRIYTGYRPMFSGGIEMIRKAGLPDPIRNPWSWSRVQFETLTVDMYNCLTVRIPCMEIENVQGANVRVKVSDDFDSCMQNFHEMAGATPWNHCITIHGLDSSAVGARLMATIVPAKNNEHVEWTTLKHRIIQMHPTKTAATTVRAGLQSHEETVVGKRHADNTDTLNSEKTKRQCTSNGTNVHKTMK